MLELVAELDAGAAGCFNGVRKERWQCLKLQASSTTSSKLETKNAVTKGWKTEERGSIGRAILG